MTKFPEKWLGSINLAADSIEKLRQCDVDRVLADAPSPSEAHEMGAAIIKSRPDLKEEILEILKEDYPLENKGLLPEMDLSEDFSP